MNRISTKLSNPLLILQRDLSDEKKRSEKKKEQSSSSESQKTPTSLTNPTNTPSSIVVSRSVKESSASGGKESAIDSQKQSATGNIVASSSTVSKAGKDATISGSRDTTTESQKQAFASGNIANNPSINTASRTAKETQQTSSKESVASSQSQSKSSDSSSDTSASSVASRTAKAANALGSATLHYTYEFNKLYYDVEKNVMSKINESNRRRFRLIVLSILIGTIVLFLVFGTKIRKGITDGTADIAKETLENESLKIQTQELAMAVVQTILNDKEITSHAANFLREASTVSETQAALLQLTLHVLQHPESLHELQILVKKLLGILSEDKVSNFVLLLGCY